MKPIIETVLVGLLLISAAMLASWLFTLMKLDDVATGVVAVPLTLFSLVIVQTYQMVKGIRK